MIGRPDIYLLEPFPLFSSSSVLLQRNTPSTMEMELLYTVQRLAEARAAEPPPPPRAGLPPRTSLRERTAQALAAADAAAYEDALLRARYPDTTGAALRALRRQKRDRRRILTRPQAEDVCWALLDERWDPSVDDPPPLPDSDSNSDSDSDSDSEEEEALAVAIDQRAARLNEWARRLWARHEAGIAATTPRYVDGFPVRFVAGPPTVRRRPGRVRDSGRARCGGCAASGLRCSRMTVRRRGGGGASGSGREGSEEAAPCERCRRRGEVCEDEDERDKGILENERHRFALPLRNDVE
ncbi:hypothetical protein IF2G_00356 [Cordyceps javanica]|nr:hypothetical protein IF2G_00356 [Cordyceps javanica]